jgi:MoaA/NifB/PqqE/SkfB family radical SAM enzyme
MTKDMGPSTLTVLPTYRCTAACEQCCFGSNPNLEERLSLEEIERSIREARENFPALRLVVFSGGECTMLGQDLFQAINTAHHLNLKTRIVTNGHWGAVRNKEAIIKEMSEMAMESVGFAPGV